MAAHKGAKGVQKVAKPTANGKENLPPKKISKRTISVSTLFEQKHDLRRRRAEKEAEDVFAPKTARIAKQYPSPRGSKRAEQNPLFQKLLGVTKEYRDATAAGRGNQLEPVYNELIASVDNLAVGDATNSANEHGSHNQLHTLLEEQKRLANPLGEDKIEVHRVTANGSTIAEERKLSDTMKAFERVLETKRGELEAMLRELKDVNTEIAAVKQDILSVEQKEAKRLKRDLDNQVAGLTKETEKCKVTTLAEVDKARKEDKKAVEVQNQKFADFMKTIF